MGKKPKRVAKPAKPAKPAKKAKSKKSEAPAEEAPEEQLFYKGMAVKVLGPATPKDSYYMAGQDQVIVELPDGNHATAFRVDVQPKAGT